MEEPNSGSDKIFREVKVLIKSGKQFIKPHQLVTAIPPSHGKTGKEKARQREKTDATIQKATKGEQRKTDRRKQGKSRERAGKKAKARRRENGRTKQEARKDRGSRHNNKRKDQRKSCNLTNAQCIVLFH